MIFELKINSTFRLNSPFHSTGDVVSLKVDNPLSKDKLGNVIVPATLIKGTLRHNIEMTLRSLNKTVCFAPSPSEMCNNCIICRLFGSPSNKARLFFFDTKIFADKVMLQTPIGTAIDRKTKTVREKALFSTEVSYYPDEFSVMIEGIFTNENDAIISAGGGKG